ncbi:MAG TPA: GAF domain-containing protein [Longimicrobium sp.]|nr:GAF domain-containing protein [Longimicrobium sp.]
MKHHAEGRPTAAQTNESARDRLDRCQAEVVRLRRRAEAAESANHRMAAEHAELAEGLSVLTRLWVAASALHEAANEDAALRALEEVMINLAGTEEFAVFEIDGGGLVPLHAFGVADGRLRPHAPAGVVARVMESGDAWRADAPHPDPSDAPDQPWAPVACIPLRMGDRVAGVVVVWSFLPQKMAFEPFDVELYALLANRAAPALRASRLLGAAA